MELQIQVAKAVHVLNHDAQSCNRVTANQWLVQFQHSDAAWEVAMGILSSDSSCYSHGFEVELFAAQILKRKIQNEGVNLQPEYRHALQTALLASAKKFSTGPPQLLTQICLALSALILRAVESRKPIEQLFASLYEVQEQGCGSNAILELLTVLPEELIEDQSVNASVDSTRRWHFTQELLSHTVNVLDFLMQQTQDASIKCVELYDRHRKVLRSLLSWARVGCFLELPPGSISSHPLLDFVYNALQVSATFDLAIEVLTELISRHEDLPQALLMKAIISVQELLLLPAIANKNDRVVAGVACLFTEIGQAAPMLIAEGTCEAFELTGALLRCVAYPSQDWEIPDSTLSFWCSLAEFILGSTSETPRMNAISSFAPIYTSLLDVLFLRAEVPNYNISELDGFINLPDGLLRFRRNLEELLLDICCFLGTEQFLAQLLGGTWITLDSAIPWQVVEVRLFALNIVAEAVLEEEGNFDLSIVMRLMMAMQTNSIDGAPPVMHLVHKSAAEVAGSFFKILCPQPSLIMPVLSFLASGLTIRAASSSCAVALRKICEDSSGVLGMHGNLEGLLWIGEGLHTMCLSLREEEDLICAIGSVLAPLNNDEILNVSLKRVLKPCYATIEALLCIDSNRSVKYQSTAYAAALDAGIRGLTRLGLMLSHLSVSRRSGDDPVFNILQSFWPLLEQILSSHLMENNALAAALCRSLSYIIQASGEQFAAFLPDVMTALSRDFISFQSNECFIRTAVVALEEFGHKKELGSLFVDTLKVFTTAEVIAMMNSSYGCDQEPDIVEAYMSFTSAFLCCCPEVVIIAAFSLVEISFIKATIFCTAMHRGAALAAMSYLSRFLEIGAASLMISGAYIGDTSLARVFLTICLHHGESAISSMLYALLGVSAMTRVHKAATILQQLATICHLSDTTNWGQRIGWNIMHLWLTSAIQALPSEYLRPGESEELIISWLKALQMAALDYYNSKLSNLSGSRSGGCMDGEGGRALKRLVRSFADAHRHATPT